MIEEWRMVKGFQDRYMVSSFGHVKSLYRLKSNLEKIESEIILKPMVYKNGITKVTLSAYKNGLSEKKTMSVHRLVAEAFLRDYDKYPYVDHINHDPSNNMLSNLRMCTNQMNQGNRLIANIAQKSKYKGVTVDERTGRYKASVRDNKVRKHIGVYDNEVDAALAYDSELSRIHGEFALTNKKLGLLDGSPKEGEE